MSIQTLREAIKNRASSSTNMAVEDALAVIEINNRRDKIISGLAQLDQLNNNVKKFKPDVITFSAVDGNRQEAWSEAKIKEKEKNEKEIFALTEAINLALDGGNFEKINNLVKSDNQNNQKKNNGNNSSDSGS